MHIFSILLVIAGLVALVLSLIPLTGICRHEIGYRLGWRAMFVLVLAFILGYMFFCYHLIFKAPTLIDLILSSIFAGGGFFVVLVSRMSLASLNELQETALVHEQQALHDELTGLKNRKSLMLTLANTVAASGRGNAHFAVMVMDLNGFKEVNDTLGHQIGDVALQVIAPRLSKQLRASDTLCRMGGDEFAVILPQAGREESVLVAKKILAATAKSMIIENKKIILGISIGISLSPHHTRDGNTLLRYADIAMYQAKQKKIGVEIYSKEIDRSSINELSDIPEILQALQDKKLVMYYQPVFANDALKGLEVSLRWHKADGSVILARNFIKSLVDLGASWSLIEYVVDETFLYFSRWMKQYTYDFNLRLNLFLGSVDEDELCEFMISKAHQYEIPTNNIMIEVVESLFERKVVINLLETLHSKGFKTALDDFGDNGARLLPLRNIILDEVKLGQTVIGNSTIGAVDIIFINTIKSFCEQMNISFVVPNVQNALTLAKLKEMGIDQFQGDALCPFISASEMNEWLSRYSKNKEENS
jgi:diguanylate cyclase (GGDEF)-like protein